jgi:hypothetical protein
VSDALESKFSDLLLALTALNSHRKTADPLGQSSSLDKNIKDLSSLHEAFMSRLEQRNAKIDSRYMRVNNDPTQTSSEAAKRKRRAEYGDTVRMGETQPSSGNGRPRRGGAGTCGWGRGGRGGAVCREVRVEYGGKVRVEYGGQVRVENGRGVEPAVSQDWSVSSRPALCGCCVAVGGDEGGCVVRASEGVYARHERGPARANKSNAREEILALCKQKQRAHERRQELAQPPRHTGTTASLHTSRGLCTSESAPSSQPSRTLATTATAPPLDCP